MKAFVAPPPATISFAQRIDNLAASGFTKLLPAAFALSALAMPASAATNLVKNGSFETNTGPGKIFDGFPDKTVANWSFTRPSPNEGFAGIQTYAQGLANATNGINWWGVKPGFQNANGFVDSPDGGYFLSNDSDPRYSVRFSQTITGLTVGDKYDLGFFYAYGQEACSGCNGATYGLWAVNFGSEHFNTGFTSVPDHGFRGWYTAAHTYTATAVTQTLLFAAVGPEGGPPMALIDGIILTAQNEPPAPAAATPGPLPLLGLGASFAWSGRLRKRINQGGKA